MVADVKKFYWSLRKEFTVSSMIQFDVVGGTPLRGSVAISGSKNAALPAMCAALLSDSPSTLTNVPDISDVHSLARILESTGARVVQIDRHTWEIGGAGMTRSEIDYLLGRRLRASVLLLGPILARLGKIKLPHPGGCVIGKRPVGTHFEALRGLGATIEHQKTDEGHDYYIGSAPTLHGAYLYLDEVSVTATENAVMAAALAEGVTTIRPAAMEPHVVNLCEMLIRMGAHIEGVGTHTLVVTGVNQLRGANHRVVSDEIETGTYAVAAAITNGELTLTNVPSDLDPILYKLKVMGVDVQKFNDTLIVKRGSELVGTNLQVDTWPRFPTDLQPQFGALATQASGETHIHEWMYENRLNYTKSLAAMGASVSGKEHNPHQVTITGPSSLHAATIESPDLRSGIAFVLAALAADGESHIEHAELILRGYEGLVEKMTAIGAKISQTEVEVADATA
jgi:UDP-N-acetylglucosamine 1-carboxyvinyltransferase